MKAIVLKSFGSVDNFAIDELPVPDVGQGEVRIKVKAVSFNPVDYQIRKGLSESTHVRSMILGRDLSGEIDAVSPDIADFSPGDEVFSYVCNLASNGTYAEYVSVPAELVARKPRSLTHEQSAAVPVAGITAGLALSKARASPATSLFVAGGAGGVGTFAIILARRLGVRRLIATAGSARSRAYLVEHCGLNDDQVVDYKQAHFIEQALARNDGPFDCVLDLVGGRMLAASCRLLAIDGNLVSITEAPSREDFDLLFDKNASFHSVGANAYSLSQDRAAWQTYRRILEELTGAFDSGAIAPPPVQVLGMMSVDVVRQAHMLLETGSVQGKLVMKM